MKQVERIMREQIADLPRRWREEFQPELERDLAAGRAFDLQGASWDALVQHFLQAIELSKRHWEIHFLTVFPVLSATRPIAEMYARLTGDRDEQTPYRLLMGFPSKTSERDLALWTLSEIARQPTVVTDALRQAETAVVLAQLRALPAAQDFVQAFDAFIEQYGDRGEGALDRPTWREDPTFLLRTLKAYLMGGRRDLHAEQAAVAAERERLLRETLASIPDAEREAFLRETHAFYIDQASVSQFRYIVIELAKRLSALGVLDQPDDVFYLELDELLSAIGGPAAARVKAIIAARKENYVRWSKLIAPAWIGAPPPPEQGDPERAKFFRPIDTEMPQGPITQLKGAAGSKGVARATTRVVSDAREFARVQPGDVLVCATTQPSWTPLFRVVSALVADAGGVLSHGAIVAREYKLPAVVGTGYATRAIQDAQLIEVDGTNGMVTILAER